MTASPRDATAIALAIALGLRACAPTHAQDSSLPPTPVLPRRPALMASLGYDKLTAPSASLTLLIPVREPDVDGDLGAMTVKRGIALEATCGVHGARLAVGSSALGKDDTSRTLFGWDVLANVTQTWDQPIREGRTSTYAGAEAGWTFLSVRLTVGIAQRVAGPSGPGGTIVTWSAGIQLPLTW